MRTARSCWWTSVPASLSTPRHGAEYGRTLIDQIQAYLYAQGEWDPKQEHAFAPALCNRIDRNTGGIVIAAKTAEALRILNQKIKDREIDKRYLCIIHGTPQPREGRLEGYLFKDAVKKPCLRHQNAAEGREDLLYALSDAANEKRPVSRRM